MHSCSAAHWWRMLQAIRHEPKSLHGMATAAALLKLKSEMLQMVDFKPEISLRLILLSIHTKQGAFVMPVPQNRFY